MNAQALPLVPYPRSVEYRDESAFVSHEASILEDSRITRTIGGERVDAEGYRIDVTSDGIAITAADPAGAFYAEGTLRELARRGGEGEGDGDAWIVPAVAIADAPRFAHRGIMLDVARHFFGVDVIERFIDDAAALKFNRLHLHLSDDQGWRLAIDARPELAARASGSAVGGALGGYFTAADYRRIIEHAASRHMIVIPEIDLPGHTHAVGLAYPELVSAPVIGDVLREQAASLGEDLPEAGRAYTGIGVGFSSLALTPTGPTPAVAEFVRDVLAEVAALTPGPWLHIGGDEALGTDRDAYCAFLAHVTALVGELGKTPIAWHEAGHAPVAPGTWGQYWSFVTPAEGADAAARAFAEGGGRVVLSPADAAYLDMKPAPDARLGLTWANGPTSLERAYAWEPTGIVPGLDAAAIAGVEACLWTETIETEADIREMVRPRIAAIAEIAWSPAPDASPARSWESFRERVATLESAWEPEA